MMNGNLIPDQHRLQSDGDGDKLSSEDTSKAFQPPSITFTQSINSELGSSSSSSSYEESNFYSPHSSKSDRDLLWHHVYSFVNVDKIIINYNFILKVDVDSQHEVVIQLRWRRRRVEQHRVTWHISWRTGGEWSKCCLHQVPRRMLP